MPQATFIAMCPHPCHLGAEIHVTATCACVATDERACERGHVGVDDERHEACCVHVSVP